PAATRDSGPAVEGLTRSLDLRGQRADEALRELERFLDDCLLRGAGRAEIIHGRGTGALRREVHEFLRQFPAVDAFALAPEDRGGDGMTEVTLK
ncbi:MAG TPA: endonuclease MutS2, partial [Desulfovibrio sp.]|nr:endonuclease MutS2 [Desulfovibrio sp.]